MPLVGLQHALVLTGVLSRAVSTLGPVQVLGGVLLFLQDPNGVGIELNVT